MFKNQGSYGELGHWGKRNGRQVSRKKIAILISILILAVIFSISRNPFQVYAVPDYNTSYSHTRTNIFRDTNLNGTIPAIIGNLSGSLSGTSNAPFGGVIKVGSIRGVCFKSGLSVAPTSASFYLGAWDGFSSGFVTVDVYATTTAIPNCTVPNNIGPLFSSSTSVDITGLPTGANWALKTFSFTGASVLTSGTNYYVGVRWVSGGEGAGTCISMAGVCFSLEDQTRLMAQNGLRCNISTGPCTSTGSWNVGTNCANFGCQYYTLTGTTILSEPSTNPSVRWNFNQTCVRSFKNGNNFTFTYTNGNNLGVSTTLDSFHFNNVTGLFGNQTAITGQGETFSISGNSWQIQSVTLLMNRTGVITGNIGLGIFAISGTAGVDALPVLPVITSANPVALSSLPIGPAVQTSFTFTSSPILSPGNYALMWTNNATVVPTATSFTGNGMLGVQIAIPSSYAGHNNFSPGAHANRNYWFTVSGLNRSPGINCNSADIAITKTAINMQSGAARMLEMVQSWLPDPSGMAGSWQRSDFVLRTNGTLPSFTEKYNPYNDTAARLVWSVCIAIATSNECKPSVLPNLTLGMIQALYIAHDTRYSISQETQQNDFIISNLTPNAFSGTNEYQAVLNFTGPTNYMSWASGVATSNNSTQNSASQFQFGQDYYLLVKANFDTSFTPDNNQKAIFINTEEGSFGHQPVSIFSVPASCSDFVNKAACSIATTQPTFDINPLDPTSWGNAIIKGLTWIFLSAIPQGLLFIVNILSLQVRSVGNFIGGLFGWGNVGDNLITFLSGIGSLFGAFQSAIAWLNGLITSAISIISTSALFNTPEFNGLRNFLSDAANSAPLLVQLFNEIAFWFPNSYMIILITFYFLLVMANGFNGFFEWMQLVKWSAFSISEVFLRILAGLINLVTWLISKFGSSPGINPGHDIKHKSSIPHLHPGPFPRPNLGHREWAMFHDPVAWFLLVTGFVFTFLWAGTASSGLPATTTSVMSAMSNLVLTLFGIGFMVLILVIPGWMIGKMYERGIITE